MILVIIGGIFLKKKKFGKTLLTEIKSLCIASVLAALYTALELIAISTGAFAFGNNYQIPISCFPLIIASILLGVYWGTSVGIVGSFLSQLLSYGIGWSSLIWMFPTIIYSLTVAVLYKTFNKNNKFYVIAFELIISSLVLSILNVLAKYLENYISDLTNSLLAVFLPIKLVLAVVFAIVFAITAPPIIKKLRKFIR